MTVRGRVQGVGYRDFVRRRAHSAGLRGWVRNLPDGSVECVAEGPATDLERFAEQLRKGPGTVTRVETSWQEPAAEKSLEEFGIVG